MIYLVSDTIDCSKIDGVDSMSVEDSIGVIRRWPVVMFDVETTGLNPHVNALASMQFGYKDFNTGEKTQIVVDCASVDPKKYKSVIEHSLLIGHNLKFDLQFLYNYGIVPLSIYDTYVCEQTLYLGYKPGKVAMNLHDVLLRYTGIDLDKSYQKLIADKGLTPEGIVYAAHDVEYLQDIRKGQILMAKDRKCLNAFTVENRFVPAIAYLEWCGIHLDEKKWKEKMKNDNDFLSVTRTSLDNYVLNNTKLNTQFVTTYSQPSLWDDNPSFTPSCTVEWDSPKQVIPVVKALGFNTEVIDKKTKKPKDSVNETTLTPQKGINDEFLNLYFDYKGAAKIVSSYGQNYLNLVNPKTGRLHTEFNQFGTVTGRMSSGGGDDSSKGKMDKALAEMKGLPADEVRYVNLQNIPARGNEGKITRACFTAEEGNVFVSCDYSAEESRVSANVWNEKSLLDAFHHGIDTHNLYAKIFFPEELKDIDVKDVKEKRPDLRQSAKYLEFEAAYGGKGYASAAKLGLDTQVVLDSMSQLQKVMKGMASFKKKCGKFLKEHGYIVINEKTGHRIYWPEWASWKAEDDTYDQRFWNDFRAYHQGTDDEVCRKLSLHKKKGEPWFEKNVLNYPIQGGSAIVLKHAAANLFKWIVEHGYFGKILFCVFVHDEIDCECPKEIADSFAKTMERIMEKAAATFYKRLAIPAECSVGPYWIH